MDNCFEWITFEQKQQMLKVILKIDFSFFYTFVPKFWINKTAEKYFEYVLTCVYTTLNYKQFRMWQGSYEDELRNT